MANGRLFADITPEDPTPVNVYRWHFGKIIEEVEGLDDEIARPNTSCAAQILQQLVYRAEQLERRAPQEFAAYVRELSAGVTAGSHGWIRRSAREMSRELGEQFSRSACGRALNFLVEAGFVSKRSNPDDPYDQTNQYRVELGAIRAALEEHYEMPLEREILPVPEPDQAELFEGEEPHSAASFFCPGDREGASTGQGDALREQLAAMSEQVRVLREQLAAQDGQSLIDPTDPEDSEIFEEEEREAPPASPRTSTPGGSEDGEDHDSGEGAVTTEAIFESPELAEGLEAMFRLCDLDELVGRCEAIAERVLLHYEDDYRLRSHLYAKVTRLAISHGDRPSAVAGFLLADADDCQGTPRRWEDDDEASSSSPQDPSTRTEAAGADRDAPTSTETSSTTGASTVGDASRQEDGGRVVELFEESDEARAWRMARERVVERIAGARERSFVESLRCVRCTSEELVLDHDDEFVLEWLRDHHHAALEEAVREVVGAEVRVRLGTEVVHLEVGEVRSAAAYESRRRRGE
jgi:hypothetical protein